MTDLAAAEAFFQNPANQPIPRPAKKVINKTRAREACVFQNQKRTSRTWVFCRIKTAKMTKTIMKRTLLNMVEFSFLKHYSEKATPFITDVTNRFPSKAVRKVRHNWS